MRWSPSQPNSWWPHLSPDGSMVAYGNGHVWVALLNITPVPELDIGPGYVYGWHAPNILFYGIELPGDRGELHQVVLDGTGQWFDSIVSADPTLCWGNPPDGIDAADGHWGTWLASAAGRIVRDDTVLATGGHYVKVAGPCVAWLSDGATTITRWQGGGARTTVPLFGPNALTLNADGYIGYGYFGPAGLIWPAGHQADVTVTPWKQETPPIVVADLNGADWLWCGTEDPFDQALIVVGHPIGDPTCLILDQPFGSLSVRLVGSHWRVAGCSTTGALVVQDIPWDAARVPLVDRRPEMPPANVDFAIDRMVGIITTHEYCRTHRWQMDDVTIMPEPGKPNDGMTYDFAEKTPGLHTIRLLAQGVLADDAHLPDSGGKLVYTPSQPIVINPPLPPPYPTGFYGVLTGFGEPVHEALDAQLRIFGWEMNRISANPLSPDTTRRCVQQVLDAGQRPLTICWSLTDLRAVPEYTDVQWMNEPDIGTEPTHKMAAAQYRATLLEAIPVCEQRHLRLWAGCVSNTSPDQVDYMRRVFAGLPLTVGAAWNRYPQFGWDVASIPRDPYSSMLWEFDAMLRATGIDRPWGITEMGWMTGEQRQRIFRRLRWPTRARTLTYQEICDRYALYFALVKEAGGAFCCVFQINDGIDDDKFGLHTGAWFPGGQWKDSAYLYKYVTL